MINSFSSSNLFFLLCSFFADTYLFLLSSFTSPPSVAMPKTSFVPAEDPIPSPPKRKKPAPSTLETASSSISVLLTEEEAPLAY